jgi:hypothetical protein
LAPLRANLENTYDHYKNGFISEELYQDVMVPLCVFYGRPMVEFGLPFTRRFGTRLASRTKRVAAKSIAAIPAESIPFLGVAVLIADTSYELYAACD